jgi:hypothetical protein
MNQAITLYDPNAQAATAATTATPMVALCIAVGVVVVTAIWIGLVVRARGRRTFGRATLDLLGSRLGLSSIERRTLLAMAQLSKQEDCPAALMLSRSAFVAGLTELSRSSPKRAVLAAAGRLARYAGYGEVAAAIVEAKPAGSGGKAAKGKAGAKAISPRHGSGTTPRRAKEM